MKKSITISLTTFCLLATSLSLTAGLQNAGNDNTQNGVVINSDNALQISAEGFEIFNPRYLSTISSLDFLALLFIEDMTNNAETKSQNNVFTLSENCTISGSNTITFEDKDGNNAWSAGDVFTLSAAAYKYHEDEEADSGTASITYNSENKRSMIATNDTGKNSLVATEASNFITMTMSGHYIDSRTNNGQTSKISITYNGTFRIDTSNQSLTTAGTFSVGGLGTLSVSVPANNPITFDNYDIAGGMMVITGANESKINMILSTDSVSLNLDSNGDGNEDDVINASWDQLQSLVR